MACSRNGGARLDAVGPTCGERRSARTQLARGAPSRRHLARRARPAPVVPDACEPRFGCGGDDIGLTCEIVAPPRARTAEVAAIRPSYRRGTRGSTVGARRAGK